MNKMIIYDPAMCCSTGVCGPSPDSELMRVATVLNNLKKNGIAVERYGLTSNPQAFIANDKINSLLKSKGSEALPAVVVDGEIVKMAAYPTNEEFVKWLNVPLEYLTAQEKKSETKCDCGPKGCC